jgi:DNA uptake protein ComE-like DNA-binding protein
MKPGLPPRTPARNAASVLVAVLWCLAILFVVAIGVLHTSRLDLIVAKRYADRLQAHYLAVAGIERAKALIYDDARNRTRNRRNHNGELFDAPASFRDTAWGRGHFRIVRRAPSAEGGGLIYGVSDEESKLDLNQASPADLGRLNGMTPEVAAAIADWRDGDNEASPGGAEIEYYASLTPPRRPRNGPFETVRELLMVRGVRPELLLGSDADYNAQIPQLDEKETVATSWEPGWAELLTVHSQNDNVNAAGTDRVNIQTADERALTAIPGISQEIARAIVAYRSKQKLESIADLLEVTAAPAPGQEPSSRGPDQRGRPASPPRPANRPGQPPAQPAQPAEPAGPKVISASLLMAIADDLTVNEEDSLPGVMNINTASLEALLCLPGMTRELASQITTVRQSGGFFQNVVELLRVPGFTADLLKRLEPRITTRSETYRIFSEGIVDSTGARQRIEEIVHIGMKDVVTLAYRERDL